VRTNRVLLALLACGSAAIAQVVSLPPPIAHGNSFEIISNSRCSSHSGFTSSLSDTVLANVLWAMSRVPSFGSSYREIYAATPSNVYLYDTASHVLNVHLAGNHRYSSSSAFEVGISVESNEEAGLAVQAGLLAGDAFWGPGNGIVTSCPMAFAANYADTAWHPNHTINLVDVFGRMSVSGLTDSCVAISSDSTLPMPETDRRDTFELLIGGLMQDSVIGPDALSLSAASQLLWAGYGVTPHMPTGKRGLTVPSAVANYYLTRRIYVVTDTAVMRYHNRLPSGSMSSGDHRLEEVVSGDRRDSLRGACSRLPIAPLYIVVCVGDTTDDWAMIEPGFVGFQYLMQAHALGLHGRLTAPLSSGERSAIVVALGLPGTDLPALVFSTGEPSAGAPESSSQRSERVEVVRTEQGVRLKLRLTAPATARLVIYDLAGRPVRSWGELQLPIGVSALDWNGVSDAGKRLPSGPYFCRLALGRTEPAVLTTRVDIAR
jgi:hypothetical protein